MVKRRSTKKRGLKAKPKPKAKRKPVPKAKPKKRKKTIGQVLGLTPDKPVIET